VEKKIVAFCNISNRFIEQIRSHLQSQNVEIVTVARESDNFPSYLRRLSGQLLGVVRKFQKSPDFSIFVMVISGSKSDSEIKAEHEEFFPATRYLRVDREMELSQPRGRAFVDSITTAFSIWKQSNLNKLIKPGKNRIALLPLRNVNSTKFRNSLTRIWQLESADLSPDVSKDLNVQSGDRGIIAGALEFRGCLNGPGHPVRRCTDSPSCDLKAELRLGHLVPPHFEFDVTSIGCRISTRKLFLCDGRMTTVDKSASHLNMRINDDFKPGYK
jgi:hypothetical protein